METGVDDNLVLAGLAELAPGLPVQIVWGAKTGPSPSRWRTPPMRPCRARSWWSWTGPAHVPYLERPEVFNEAFLDFVTRRVLTTGRAVT
ncbi:hypothetical protein MXD62_06950 [Frankia sp. Mgl5]|uniref:hypothetical protein n=1 Tax=Frankia sp. Mgl5 TaxID=2933793 RepID=UPI00200F2DE9|nr:hypothetical protein [Frankia sp. Mgl5]MCK9926906.1 hypothetical protein [Frankia sp. Mgl5]